MSTAILSDVPATQLTFPWAMPKAECEAVIVADRGTKTETRQPEERRPREEANHTATRTPNRTANRPVNRFSSLETSSEASLGETSLAEVMEGDRIGRPFRVGSVMFRLLKSYGITDEEIAEGVAQYTAKQNTAKQIAK